MTRERRGPRERESPTGGQLARTGEQRASTRERQAPTREGHARIGERQPRVREPEVTSFRHQGPRRETLALWANVSARCCVSQRGYFCCYWYAFNGCGFFGRSRFSPCQ